MKFQEWIGIHLHNPKLCKYSIGLYLWRHYSPNVQPPSLWTYLVHTHSKCSLYKLYMQTTSLHTLIRTIPLKLITRRSYGGTKGLLGEPRLEENLGSKLGVYLNLGRTRSEPQHVEPLHDPYTLFYSTFERWGETLVSFLFHIYIRTFHFAQTLEAHKSTTIKTTCMFYVSYYFFDKSWTSIYKRYEVILTNTL